MKYRNTPFKIALIVLSVFIGFAAVELFLRLIHYAYYPMHIQTLADMNVGSLKVPKEDWRLFSIFGDNAFVYDPELIWKPNVAYTIQKKGKDILFFNSLGLPGPLFSSNDLKNKYRILAIGDSNTLGLRDYDTQTGREVSWPGYLEALLGKDYAVLNAGVWGYSSYQTYKRFNLMLIYNPSLVVFSPSGNDGHPVTVDDTKYTLLHIGILELLVHTRLAQLIAQLQDRYIYLRKSPTDVKLVPRVSLAEYKSILSDIISTAKKRHIRLVLLTRPYKEDGKTIYNVEPYNTLTREMATQNSLTVIDVEAHFASMSSLFIDPTHFNQQGLQEMARYIHQSLKL